MSNYFPQELIDQVRSANDIVEVVSEYVSLKKKGRNYFGLCPFHTEKTPSFSVNPEKQIFHCFGCGQGGNAVSFLMTHDKLGFVEAIKLLAKRANIRLPQKEYDRKKLELTDKLYHANQMGAAYYSGNLSGLPSGKEAQAYLEKRRVSKETSKTFQLGLALEEWDGLLKFCISKGVEQQTLLTAGLIIERSDGKGFYDRFKNRLMFPIFNLSGKIVALAGRIIDEKDNPKYLNSPETPIYQKGKLLYGLNFSKEKIRESRFAIVVEGYMDFLSLHQAGLQNLVASCGTAFSANQARLLARFAEEVILLFDSDNAGEKATLRSVDLLYDAGLEVKVAVLPKGFDPDSYLNNYGELKLRELINQAVGYVKFKASFLNDRFANLSLREQEGILMDFAQTAARISQGVRRELFLKQVSEQLDVSESIVRKALLTVTGKKDTEQIAARVAPQKPGPQAWEKEFLALVMDNWHWFKKAETEIVAEDFSTSHHQELWRFLSQQNQAREEFDLADFLEKAENASLRQLLLEIASLDFLGVESEILFEDYIRQFRAERREREINKIKQSLKNAEAVKDEEAVQTLSSKLHNLLQENTLTVSSEKTS